MSYDSALKKLIVSFGVVVEEDIIVSIYQNCQCDYNQSFKWLKEVYGGMVNVRDEVPFGEDEIDPTNEEPKEAEEEKIDGIEVDGEAFKFEEETPEEKQKREIEFLQEIYPNVDNIPRLYHEQNQDLSSCVNILSIFYCNFEIDRSRGIGVRHFDDGELPPDRVIRTTESGLRDKQFEDAAKKEKKKKRRRRKMDKNTIDRHGRHKKNPVVRIVKEAEPKIRELLEDFKDISDDIGDVDNKEKPSKNYELIEKLEKSKIIEDQFLEGKDEKELDEEDKLLHRQYLEERRSDPNGFLEGEELKKYEEFEINIQRLVDIYGIVLSEGEITQALIDAKNEIDVAVEQIMKIVEKRDKEKRKRRKKNQKKKQKKKKNLDLNRIMRRRIDPYNPWTNQRGGSRGWQGGPGGRPKTSVANFRVEKVQKMCLPFGISPDEVEKIYHQSQGNAVKTVARVQALARERGLYNPNADGSNRIRSDTKSGYVPESPMGWRRNVLYDTHYDELANEVSQVQKDRDRHYSMSVKELTRNNHRMSGIHKAKGMKCMERINELTRLMNSQKYTFERANYRRTDMKSFDLHGLNVQDAKTAVEDHIHMCQKNGVPMFRLIVGKGNHSVGRMAVIRPAIAKHLINLGINHKSDTTNKGMFHVRLQ